MSPDREDVKKEQTGGLVVEDGNKAGCSSSNKVQPHHPKLRISLIAPMVKNLTADHLQRSVQGYRAQLFNKRGVSVERPSALELTFEYRHELT